MTSPRRPFTPWWRRVVAVLIDLVPVLLVLIGPLLAFDLFGTAACRGATDPTDIAWCEREVDLYRVLTGDFTVVLALAYLVWNYGYRQGKTGQSIGKSVMRFAVVRETTWRPVGFRLSIGRQLAHLFVDQAVFFVGFLFPLWDAKRQTLADMIVGTVCVPVGRPAHGER